MLDQREKAKGRKAFQRLLRQLVALVGVAVLLHQQPFMVKPRSRKATVVPLQLALSGAFHWASDAPLLVQDTVNATSRSLLTPLEYIKAPSSKRTLGAAYTKTNRVLTRITDGNSTLQHRLAAAPMPNLPLLGALLVTLGQCVAPFCAGAEYLVIGGCGGIWLGCEDLTAQPELYFVLGLAAVGLYLHRSARAPFKATPEKRRRRHTNKPHSHAD